MSSSSIYASIVSCQEQIDSLNISIRLLRIKIDEQQAALSRFPSKRNIYIDEFTDRKRRGDCVSDYMVTVVFSERFKTKGDIEMDNERYNSIWGAMDDIEQKMRDEINGHCDTLEQQESALRTADSTMTQLRIDYASALRSEENERRRAASQQQ